MGNSNTDRSAFKPVGLTKTVDTLIDEVQALYLADPLPWILGYSGGKDSTATLQLVWMALSRLPERKRTKTLHVISTDTLVENPVVAAWVTKSLESMRLAAQQQKLPIVPHRLTPTVSDSFWVNLIGKGYPAPRHKFRWCTERLKIKPSNAFITQMVASHGEAILVLGIRKAESQSRARTMERLEAGRVRERLSPNASLPNCLVYSPIEDWSNDDVWMFLVQVANPWGYKNKDLLTMYQGASQDGECPLVVDSTTPSCGDSRFGCWVCTLVDQDKSMQAMIQNDEEKEWMLPLLKLRNKLDRTDDRDVRDFRRMSGLVQIYMRKVDTEDGSERREDYIPGPYTQTARAEWLRLVLEAQNAIRTNPLTPENVRDIELITLDELRYIRRIWVTEKHEIEDLLPSIYREAVGANYLDDSTLESTPWGPGEFAILREICGDENRLQYEMVRELLYVEQSYRTAAKRAGLFDQLETAIRKTFFKDSTDALEYASNRQRLLKREAEEADTAQARTGIITALPTRDELP
jgi:DNA sulfur modification protein DndC